MYLLHLDLQRNQLKSYIDNLCDKSIYLESNDAGIFRVNYRQVCNIRRTLVGNNIVDHSDVVGASPVGAAPTTSS